MKLEGIEGTARTVRSTFESLWRPLGWVEVPPEVPVAEDALGHGVADLGVLTRDELDTVAAAAGIDPTQAKTKGELIDTIRAATAAPTPSGDADGS